MNVMMKVYAIRLKDSNYYLPANQPSKHTKSYSEGVPIPEGGHWGPRLFYNKQSARQSLAAWLQGVWYSDWIGRYDDPILSVREQPQRHAEDMEIVEFELVEVRE